MLNTRDLGAAQHKTQATPPALETEARMDPELERHGETPGTIDTAVSGDNLDPKKSSSLHCGPKSTPLSDNRVGTSTLKGSERVHSLGTTGDEEGEEFSVVEEQPPGIPFLVQPASWNLWQQPSKVPRSSPWPHPRRSQGFLSEATASTTAANVEVTNANAGINQASRMSHAACPAPAGNPHPQRVDATGDTQAQPVREGCVIERNPRGGPCIVDVVDATGLDGNDAQALPPLRKSSDALANPAGERDCTPRKAGIPPRRALLDKVIPGGVAPRSVRNRRQGQHSSPFRSKRSSEGVGTKYESRKLSARAASAAAAAAAVLNDDFRRKSESDVEASYRNSLALSTQQSHAGAVAPEATVGGVEGVGVGSRSLSGDRFATPVRRRALFSSREARAQRKGPKILDYLKGSLSTAGAERSNSNDIVRQGVPIAHTPPRVRTPASTPGTGRKGAAPFSTPRRWRRRSFPIQGPDPEIQPQIQTQKLQRGEEQGQPAATPSSGPETAAVAGIVSSAIRATDPGDAGHTSTNKDNDMRSTIELMDSNYSNKGDDDKAARSEWADRAEVDGGEGEVTGEGKEGSTAAVAPEELEEGNEDEDKKGENEAEEEEEEEEEPEALVSETCSFTGRLECGRALRVEGKIVGELLSSGSVIVGPTGSITGDLKSIKFLMVDGQVTGNVFCDTVVISNTGKVFGNITSESITVGPEATMRGKLDVVGSVSKARSEAEAQASARPLTVEIESKLAKDRAPAVESVALDVEGRAAQSSATEEAEVVESAPGVTTRQGDSTKQAGAVEEKTDATDMKVAAADAEKETKPTVGEGWNSRKQEGQGYSSPTVAEDGADLKISGTAAEARSAEAKEAAAEAEAEVARAEDAGLPENRRKTEQAADDGSAAAAFRADSAEAEQTD